MEYLLRAITTSTTQKLTEEEIAQIDKKFGEGNGDDPIFVPLLAVLNSRTALRGVNDNDILLNMTHAVFRLKVGIPVTPASDQPEVLSEILQVMKIEKASKESTFVDMEKRFWEEEEKAKISSRKVLKVLSRLPKDGESQAKAKRLTAEEVKKLLEAYPNFEQSPKLGQWPFIGKPPRIDLERQKMEKRLISLFSAISHLVEGAQDEELQSCLCDVLELVIDDILELKKWREKYSLGNKQTKKYSRDREPTATDAAFKEVQGTGFSYKGRGRGRGRFSGNFGRGFRRGGGGGGAGGSFGGYRSGSPNYRSNSPRYRGGGRNFSGGSFRGRSNFSGNSPRSRSRSPPRNRGRGFGRK